MHLVDYCVHILHYLYLIDEDTVADISALIPETGNAAFLGEVVKAGFEKALLDAKETCSKCKVPSIKYYDTESNPQKALDHFKALYSKGARIFAGLVTSDEAVMVAEYASRESTDAVLFSPTSTASKLCKYKQHLHRLAMDDRGYAEVLFDMAVDMKNVKGAKLIHIQPIFNGNSHGSGLVSDISKRFTKEDGKGFTVHDGISYGGKSHSGLREMVHNLNKSISSNEHNIIVLHGLTEIEYILRVVEKYPGLTAHPWILSDAFVFSNVKIPDGMEVSGFTFFGTKIEDQSPIRKLNSYLEKKGLPPMMQSRLAYDTILAIQEYKQKGSLKSSQFFSGITGSLTFSACGERASGSYVFAAKLKKSAAHNALYEVPVINGWFTFLEYHVQSNKRQSAFMEEFDSLSAEALMEVNLQGTTKGSVTSVSPPVTEVKKSVFLKYIIELESRDGGKKGDIKCSHTAHISIKFGHEHRNYSIMHMPESVLIPSENGFILEASCRTSKNEYSLTRVCPGAQTGGSELICQERDSAISTDIVKKEGGGCLGTRIATGACIVGTGACFVGALIGTFGIAAPACGLAGTGCAALGFSSTIVCEQEKKKGKFVCTELFRQGYLSPDIMLADMSFAKHYSRDYPITRKGYDIIGPVLASMMSTSEGMTNAVRSFAVPWAEQMAYEKGYIETGNERGIWVMGIGSIICALVGGIYIYSNYIIGQSNNALLIYE